MAHLRRRFRPKRDAERGETLLELVMTITILGICVVAIGSGIAMSITISVFHRSQATAQDSLRNYAEILQSQYVPCTATRVPNYAGQLIVPSGFSAPTAVVDYWLPSSATFTNDQKCPVGGDTGLQQVKLTLLSTSGKVSESLVVDLRSLT